MIDLREPFGLTIFCDDVRQEVGGKMSLIGVYGADIQFSVPFPLTVPKLSLVAYYNIDARDPNRDDVELVVLFPGDPEDGPTVRSVFPIAQMIEDVIRPEWLEADGLYRLSAVMTFSPLMLKQPGEIRVRAMRSGDVIKLGSLVVREMASSQSVERVA